MKPTSILLMVAFAWSLLISDLQSQQFSYLPSTPQPNRKITISYNPAGGLLENVTAIEAAAYQFSEAANEPIAIELTLSRRGKIWSSTFIPDSSARAIFIVFSSEDLIDNGEPEGYRILLTDARHKDLPGTHAALAHAYFLGLQLIGLPRNTQLAMEHLQQELARFPAQKNKHRDLYWQLLLATDKRTGKDRILAEADSLATKGDLSLSEKELLTTWYDYLQQPEKAEALKKEIRAADPFGELVQSERLQKFYTEKDLSAKSSQLQQFKKDFPQSGRIADMEMMLINDYVTAQQYDDAIAFLETEITKPNSMLYNTVAWDMVKKDIQLDKAADLARQAIALARRELDAPTTKKPAYLTSNQWRISRQASLGYILDTYAYALYKLNRLNESIPVFAEAVQLTLQSNSDINERYVRALLDAGLSQQAYDFLNGLFQAGKSSSAFEALLKTAYQQVKGSEDGFAEHFATLKASASTKLRAKLQREMLNEVAPDFTLVDLAGNSVSLQSLRGKVVILDFWATWCGPCLASFPGMQQAVEKFKADDQVQFLFINTWERGEDAQQRVANFIKKKNYPFHVLLDSNHEVVTAYGVEGIPTKFVIDKNGMIRFKSVGYGGDAGKMVDELSLMIDMVR